MGLIEQKIKKIFQGDEKAVYCFYSTEDYLLNIAAKTTISTLLSKNDAEVTKVDGPLPSIEEAVLAAGTISFFGTKRIVELSQIEVGTMPQTDIDALCDLMSGLENAALIITCFFKEDKSKTTKKAKQIIENAKKYGICEEIARPTDKELCEIATNKAKLLDTILSPRCAILLIERCKNDAELIENEVEKLAALSNYSEIVQDMIFSVSTLNVEADVFEMVRYISSKNKVKALELLAKLLQLQNEPIAIAAALSGSFIDVYRVKSAQEKGKSYAVVFKEYKYSGSDYRLKKASETASKYKKNQIINILQILLELDLQMKSSSVDNAILLQTAICEIMNTGKA